MTGKQRVLATLEYREADRVPRFWDYFWPEFCAAWDRRFPGVDVMHHADGNVLPLLDMWIDAGIDAINPVEYRSGMDTIEIREQYGDKLVLIGGLDNCAILPRGDRTEVRDHVLHLLAAGGGGGYVFGPHSSARTSPSIPCSTCSNCSRNTAAIPCLSKGDMSRY